MLFDSSVSWSLPAHISLFFEFIVNVRKQIILFYSESGIED